MGLLSMMELGDFRLGLEGDKIRPKTSLHDAQ